MEVVDGDCSCQEVGSKSLLNATDKFGDLVLVFFFFFGPVSFAVSKDQI